MVRYTLKLLEQVRVYCPITEVHKYIYTSTNSKKSKVVECRFSRLSFSGKFWVVDPKYYKRLRSDPTSKIEQQTRKAIKSSLIPEAD